MITMNRTIAGKERELTQARADAKAHVLARSDELRQRFITPIAGQEMIYLTKEQEAIAYLGADPEPDSLTDYPFIAGEVGATAETAYQVAQVYINNAALWRAVGAALEALRIDALTQIDAAQTRTVIEAVLTQFSTDAESITTQP